MEKNRNPLPEKVAACGLYCGCCRKFIKAQCPGCHGNEKASWCTIRLCCIEHGYRSCADCTAVPRETCKKFNNFMAKAVSFVFRSDRNAGLERIKTAGYEGFAAEMQARGRVSVKRR